MVIGFMRRPERNVLLFRRYDSLHKNAEPAYVYHNEYEIEKYNNRMEKE